MAAAGAAAWLAIPMPLAGTVVDVAGRPVPGALVVASATDFGQQARVLTDQAGRFNLLGRLWPASHGLTILADGFQTGRAQGESVTLHCPSGSII